MGFESRSGLEEYKDRWERAKDATRRERLNFVENLEGDWRVERLSGPVPMPFVWKHIGGGWGTTRVSPVGPKLPFKLEQQEGHVALIYRPPLSFLVDELRQEADGSWLGRANAAGIQYAWFRMVPTRSATTRHREIGS